MRVTKEEFLTQRLRQTEIHLLKMAIGCWLLGAALLLMLAVVLDKLPG